MTSVPHYEPGSKRERRIEAAAWEVAAAWEWGASEPIKKAMSDLQAALALEPAPVHREEGKG